MSFIIKRAVMKQKYKELNFKVDNIDKKINSKNKHKLSTTINHRKNFNYSD